LLLALDARRSDDDLRDTLRRAKIQRTRNDAAPSFDAVGHSSAVHALEVVETKKIGAVDASLCPALIHQPLLLRHRSPHEMDYYPPPTALCCGSRSFDTG
jgi:hypothetical protein